MASYELYVFYVTLLQQAHVQSSLIENYQIFASHYPHPLPSFKIKLSKHCMLENSGNPHSPLHNGRTSVTLLKFSLIGLKIVAVGLILSPFCRHYKNVIHSSVAITTKDIIVL